MIFLDNILCYCFDDIFKGFFDYDVLNVYLMKMICDVEYDLVYEMEVSLMELMFFSFKQCLIVELVCFVYQCDMFNVLVEVLCEKLIIFCYDFIVFGGCYYNFKDFINFFNVGKVNLVNKLLLCLCYIWFDKVQFCNGFDVICECDVLFYYFYYIFEYVLELLCQVLFDLSVLVIKINIYCVVKDLCIIDLMIYVVYNGKKVIVVVELQVCFDEEVNIYWVKRLIEVGVYVIFFALGLKIYVKLFLILCKENGEVVCYVYIGIGNFNEKIVCFYIDYLLLIVDVCIINEVWWVFNFIENLYCLVIFDYLMVLL